MRVTVVIPARDAERTLGATLDALAVQRLAEPFEVIVVDNGSRDGTPELAERHPAGVRLLRRERGEGPGAARNDGVAAALGEVVAFTDSDCIPTESWLATGLAAMGEAEIVQGAVRPVSGVPVGPFDHTLSVASEYGLYETANLFVDRGLFRRVGGFEDVVDTRLERPFGEDALFVWRARRVGARTAFSDAALVHHAVFSGTARDYLLERRRDRHFATLTALVPELRDGFLYRRVFLNRRSAAFALGAAGTAAAALARSPAPLAAWAPWARLVLLEATERAGAPSARVAAVLAAGDAVSFAGLARRTLTGQGPLL